LITLAIFSLTDFQVTPDAVIAVLTILGYSLYDTVVVFDKINENVKGAKNSRLTYREIVNLSLNQVLARSINTSLVAVMPVISILVIGGLLLGADTLQQFGFPLLIGLLAGAYSSIFIAAPLKSDNEARDAKILSSRGSGVELLTPKAAAAMLAGTAATSGSGTGRSGTGRAGTGRSPSSRSGGATVRPGTAAKGKTTAKRTSAPAVLDDDADADGSDEDRDDGAVGVSASGQKATTSQRTSSGGSANSGNRRPPPRPRKGGGKSKGKKRR
jgi:preprotein translocase subunit SecF